MSEAVTKLEQQLEQLQYGLLRMSPKDRVRAMSTHETDDLIIELQSVVADAQKQLAELKS